MVGNRGGEHLSEHKKKSLVWNRLVKPHASVGDMHYSRILRLVAGWHLITIPLGPLLALLQALAGEPERIRSLWLVTAPLCTLINYLLTRSRWGRQSLPYQVISVFFIVVVSIYVSPDRVAPVSALLLPALAASLCFNFRAVIFVQLAALAVIALRVWLVPPPERGVFIGLGIVMLAAFAIIAAITRHREVLYQLQLAHWVAETARARALLEASFDGTATIVSGRFRSASPGFCKSLELTEDALLGQAVDDVMPFTISPEVTREDAVAYLDSKGGMRYSTVVRHSMPGSQSDTQLVAVRDVTLEQLHRANLQFADRMSSVGILATGVAHEVNNALMTLVGQTEIATLNIQRGNHQAAQQSLDTIRTASTRISSCIAEFQRFGSSAEAVPEALSLNDVVHSTLALAKHRIHGVADLDVLLTEEPVRCEAVDSWIGQVLLNLLLNAVRAIENQEDALIKVTTARDGDRVLLTVQDNGPGVPKELETRIFQPFFSTKRTREGSGLGLSVSARLASRMGGSLRLRPSKHGASFRLSLPAADAPPSPSTLGDRVLEPLASTSVLLIEDDANVVRVLVALLQPACTTSASSLEEAKQAFSVENDLIISDLALGEESGLDMLSWVLNTHPEFTDRFVLISGDASRLEALKPTLPEGVRVLAKPVSQDNLWRLFREKESSS